MAGRDRIPKHAGVLRCGIYLIVALSAAAVAFVIAHSIIEGGGLGAPAELATPASGDAAPVIYVAPVAAAGEPTSGSLSPAMVRERMIDALARYDDVTVVAAAPQPGRAASISASKPDGAHSSIYRLSTSVRYYPDGATMLIAQLSDSADDTIVWSRTYQQPAVGDPGRNGLLASDLARSLLGPFGVIQAHERSKLAAVDPMHDTYRCILDAESYLHSFDPSQYQPVHDCLLRASTELPPRVTVFADLAFLYLRSYRFGISSSPGDRSVLDNAYAMAARAVDIKPDSAFAQYALQETLLAKGDIARAKIAGDNSFRLNPDDSAIAFGHAELLILTGRIDAGLALLNENAVRTPNSWIGYHVLMALGCYLKGNLAAAAAQSRQIANPYFPPGLVLDALVADKDGDLGRAQLDLAMLSQFYPSWQKNIGAAVGRFLPVPAMAQRIAADFQAATAGLPN